MFSPCLCVSARSGTITTSPYGSKRKKKDSLGGDSILLFCSQRGSGKEIALSTWSISPAELLVSSLLQEPGNTHLYLVALQLSSPIVFRQLFRSRRYQQRRLDDDGTSASPFATHSAATTTWNGTGFGRSTAAARHALWFTLPSSALYSAGPIHAARRRHAATLAPDAFHSATSFRLAVGSPPSSAAGHDCYRQFWRRLPTRSLRPATAPAVPVTTATLSVTSGVREERPLRSFGSNGSLRRPF